MDYIVGDSVGDIAETILSCEDFNTKEDLDNYIITLRNYLYHLYSDKDNDIEDPCDSENESKESDDA